MLDEAIYALENFNENEVPYFAGEDFNPRSPGRPSGFFGPAFFSSTNRA